MFFRRPVKQWILLTSLMLGFLGGGIGAAFGQPNSWLWFGAGVLVAVALVPATASLRSVKQTQ
ncbi:hypothetical protein ASE14_06755 [Agromyces sp. Root81]|uniref:hypothetical protein n=1 Tax=Agromyces sp. Root81 TaxID=1736601 RepID=UPI0006FCFFE4|nr:hypothetical protein [Agromyces sp. Root81]KRC60680.1 hypothetical protein ASE14_06755 [Agromyces sp. Root81]